MRHHSKRSDLLFPGAAKWNVQRYWYTVSSEEDLPVPPSVRGVGHLGRRSRQLNRARLDHRFFNTGWACQVEKVRAKGPEVEVLLCGIRRFYPHSLAFTLEREAVTHSPRRSSNWLRPQPAPQRRRGTEIVNSRQLKRHAPNRCLRRKAP